jgi:hypothetical protein
MKKSKNSAELKKVENNILLVNCGTVIYALILALVYVMTRSSATVVGAISIMKIFMFGGIIAAMGVAAYAAYVSNKSFLKYSLMCFFIAVSSAALLYCNNGNKGFAVDFMGLLIALVFNLVYAFLTDKDMYYTQKKVRILFKVAVGIVYALLIVALILIFKGII